MQFLFRSLPKPQHHHRRTISDAPIKRVRDRGLDHAVEKEKNLKPVLNLKNLLKSEPSKSLPITLISQHKDSLKIPTRPIDFIRKYPSIFQEFLPGGIGVHPHIKLTPEALDLDAEEQLVYQSESFRQEAADRILKLLMITRIHKIPLTVIDELKWDLGLPQDYVKSIVPEFPDYFRVLGGKEILSGSEDKRVLELVCWSDDLAISVMEKKAMKSDSKFTKGMPIAFSMQFSRAFEMDKNMKKWVDEWQKLPYMSPYENATHLPPNSDESDKWAAAVLHELLNIFVPKKADRESVLFLGEYLGLRSRFKRVLLHHPGIFYVSTKIGTYTAVLREAFKRGLLIEKNPLMNMRYRYAHLMNTVKEDQKSISVPGGHAQQQKQTTGDSKGEGEEEEDGESGEEFEGEMYDSSDAEVEDASDDDDAYDDNEVDEDESQRGVRNNVANKRGRMSRKPNSDVRGISRNLVREKSSGKLHGETDEVDEDESQRGVRNNVANKRERMGGKPNSDVRGISRNLVREKSSGKLHGETDEVDEDESQRGVRKNVANKRGRTSRKPNSDVRGISRNLVREKFNGKLHGETDEVDEDESQRGVRNNVANKRGSMSRKPNLDVRGISRNLVREKSSGKLHGETKDRDTPKVFGRTEKHHGHNVRGRSSERSNYSKKRGSLLTEKRTYI